MLIVNVVCAACGQPWSGCDTPNCSWRAEALARALREGALLHVRCDPSNNSAADKEAGRINFDLTAYRDIAGRC